MASRSVRVGKLQLDLQNPRIARATSQRDALQKIISDQDIKLVALAESIVRNGLNPMDRLLVIQSQEAKTKFTIIEGNRRLAAIKILQNPTVLTAMDVRPLIKKRFEALAADFSVKNIEPLDCFEVASREEGAMWIQQRHTGENSGQGIVNWGGVATARFRGNDPALQALDFVLIHGGLSEAEKADLSSGFPISTLDRLLSTPAVRDIIGIEIMNGKLLTALPFDEVMKPLLRMARDLSTGAVNVTKLKLQPQMVAYASQLGNDLPDLSKISATTKAIDDLPPPTAPVDSKAGGQPENGGGPGEGGTPPNRQPGRPRKPIRRTLIERLCHLNVTNAKVAEIEAELRRLPLSDYPHAISVLLRVFLELSVDQYLTRHGIDLRFTAPGGKVVDKKLRLKITEATTHMVSNGTPQRELDGITKGIDDSNNPLYIDTLHNYVHNSFFSPTERDLTVAWDNAKPFFTRIWP